MFLGFYVQKTNTLESRQLCLAPVPVGKPSGMGQPRGANKGISLEVNGTVTATCFRLVSGEVPMASRVEKNRASIV